MKIRYSALLKRIRPEDNVKPHQGAGPQRRAKKSWEDELEKVKAKPEKQNRGEN